MIYSPSRLALSRLARRSAWIGVLSCAAITGCADKRKLSEEKVGPVMERLLPLCERDTKQVRDGMPKGVAIMAKLLDTDPGADPAGLRRILSQSREGVTDLAIAKSTFFVFVSADGVVLRSEADPDLAAGESLFKAVPEAKGIFGAGRVVETFGYMHGLRGVEHGGDLLWIAGHEVKTPDGKVPGAFVTGWSLRRYAEVLENETRQHLADTAPDKTKPIPVVYVFFARGDQAFGAPVTPDGNTEAVRQLGLPAKVASGSTFTTTLVLEERAFAVAAKAVKALGEGVAIAVLLSEV